MPSGGEALPFAYVVRGHITSNRRQIGVNIVGLLKILNFKCEMLDYKF